MPKISVLLSVQFIVAEQALLRVIAEVAARVGLTEETRAARGTLLRTCGPFVRFEVSHQFPLNLYFNYSAVQE